MLMLLEKVKFDEPGRPNYWLSRRATALHATAMSLRNNQRVQDAIDLIEKKKKIYGSKQIELRQCASPTATHRIIDLSWFMLRCCDDLILFKAELGNWHIAISNII